MFILFCIITWCSSGAAAISTSLLQTKDNITIGDLFKLIPVMASGPLALFICVGAFLEATDILDKTIYEWKD